MTLPQGGDAQMYGQILDSYQNPVTNSGVEPDDREGVEGGGHDQQSAAIYAADGLWDSDEDAERLAGDLSSDRAEGDAARRSPEGHGSGDRNEPGYVGPSEPE